MNKRLKPPGKVSMSLAAAVALRIVGGRFYRDATTGCVNLLTTDGDFACAANCSYCGLARERTETQDKTFIRVGWPEVAAQKYIEKLSRHKERLTRICVSMKKTADSLDHTLWLIRESKSAADVPVSAL